jgi:phage shock protein A
VIPVAVLDPGVISAIAAALLGGGGIGAVAVWRKAGTEAESIAAKTLIEVNQFLRQELETRDKEIKKLRERLAALRRDFDALEAEFQELTSDA